MLARTNPIRATERIEVLDLLRGFALFGILVVNMTVFSGSAWLPESETGTTDQLVNWVIELLAAGKFLNLFSFLFGVGFAIQLRRISARTDRFAYIYSRRLIALFVMGLINGVFISSVDVLQVYALLGFLLMLFSAVSQRGVLVVAVLCFLSPIIYSGVEAGLIWSGNVGFVSWSSVTDADAWSQWRIVYENGDYPALVSNRLAFWRWIYSSPDWYLSVFSTEFVLLLLGMYAGRAGIFESLDSHMGRLKSALPWLAITGILLTTASQSTLVHLSAIPDALSGALQDRLFLLGAISLSGAYASGLILLAQIPTWKGRLRPFSLTGRMALTNYILQSVICVLVFYESGLGLYNLLGSAQGLILTVMIFVSQVMLSTWWLSIARYGPLEWVWRYLTYLRMPPLLRSRDLRGFY